MMPVPCVRTQTPYSSTKPLADEIVFAVNIAVNVAVAGLVDNLLLVLSRGVSSRYRSLGVYRNVRALCNGWH